MNASNIINTTPHEINLATQSGKTINIPPSGIVSRLSVNRVMKPSISIDGEDILVTQPTLGGCVSLPDPQPGKIIIASALVAEAAKRPDVFSPGELLRGPDGKPVGCKGLCSFV